MKQKLSCLLLSFFLLLTGCAVEPSRPQVPEPSSEMALQYAERFSVRYYDQAAVLFVADSDQYLLLEGEQPPPDWYDGSYPVIRYPVSQAYLASSAVVDLFLRIDALDQAEYVSTEQRDWRIPEVQTALDTDDLLYIGKYRAPDYETLLEQGCDLVVENTMIYHNPAVKEKLEAMELPVLVEYSSYEPHPLGRVEWIKLYGLLTGHYQEAESFFQTQAEILDRLKNTEPTGKRVAFFHITPSGEVVVRRSADYVTRMIELAGGESALVDLPQEDSALSAMTIQMESFYTQAKDADVLIYNSTVAGDLPNLNALLEKSPLFADFRAVQSGEVWCTEQSMYQRSSATAGMIEDFHMVLSGAAKDAETLTYLHRVK